MVDIIIGEIFYGDIILDIQIYEYSNNIIPATDDMWEKLTESFEAYLDISESSIKAYKKALRYFFTYLVKNQITRPTEEDLYRYKKYLEQAKFDPWTKKVITEESSDPEMFRAKKYEATTINLYLSVVKEFFDFTDYKDLYPNIARRLKLEKTSRFPKKGYFTKEQLRRISQISFSDTETLKGKRDCAIYHLLVSGGLRTIEVVRANVGDFITAGGTKLYIQGKGRADANEYIAIGPNTENYILDYLAMRGYADPREPLFKALYPKAGTDGRMVTRSIRRIIREGFLKAGYNSPKLTTHSLRHSLVTNALIDGISPREVSSFVRHKNLNTTELYAHDIEADKNPTGRVLDEI